MLWFILLLLPLMSWADGLSAFHCSQEIQKINSDWQGSSEWTNQMVNGLEKGFISSPTKRFGKWILAKNLKDGAVISLAEASGRTEVKLTLPLCKKEVKIYPHSKVHPTHFNDENLKDFIEKHRRGVIYLWSPQMGLSMKGIKEITKASDKMKLPLLVLMSKDVPDSEIEFAKKEVGDLAVKKIDSFELKMRNASMHYPAIYVFKDSKIKNEAKYGYETAERYSIDLRDMLRR